MGRRSLLPRVSVSQPAGMGRRPGLRASHRCRRFTAEQFRLLQDHEVQRDRGSSGYDWVWADTVCIDKTSSAELSEAVNSMFHWYSRCSECYVYLSDVLRQEAFDPAINSFEKSEWFKRGWTLQELIAPGKVEFRDAAWEVIGYKKNLREALSSITSISSNVLRGHISIFSLSVADIMSLAIGRKTSRIEDRVYSLLGLFEVSMPLLYGEGEESFRRLQHSIIQKNPDESILAHRAHRILATSTDDLADLRNINAQQTEFYLPWKTIGDGMIIPIANHVQKNTSITPHYDGVHIFAKYLEDTGFGGRLIVLKYGFIYQSTRTAILHVENSRHNRTIWEKLGILENGRCTCHWAESKKDGRKPCERLAQRYQDHAAKREFKSKFSPSNIFPLTTKLKYEMMYIE
jgi:hypothetical protein